LAPTVRQALPGITDLTAMGAVGEMLGRQAMEETERLESLE